MRKILFRGKDEDWHWHFGNLVQYTEDDGEEVTCIVSTSRCEISAELVYVPIDTESVGEYTGLKDKDGRDIYEGDIIQSPANNIVVVEFGYKEHIIKHCRPQITDSFACYGWLARNVKNGITDFLDNEFLMGVVIGNIHDNPELINTLP